MKTVILAGGYGTRLTEVSCLMPKPMVRIGELPILCHIMKIYGTYGISEFIIALGYKGDKVKEYFLKDPGTKKYLPPGVFIWGKENFAIHLVDTGLDTKTGGRLKRLENILKQDQTFLMTYGDGLADINIKALIEFHTSHGKKATVAAVIPPEQFGRLTLEGDRVKAFQEKVSDSLVRINGGFFVLETSVLDYIDGDETVWEKEPLERLATEGELMAYRHQGFWHCIDTMKDKNKAEEMWSRGLAPWRVWGD
ncbi:MAG: glucose-1-phosphate cytidylyltransferase [Bacillota bacterium]